MLTLEATHLIAIFTALGGLGLGVVGIIKWIAQAFIKHLEVTIENGNVQHADALKAARALQDAAALQADQWRVTIDAMKTAIEVHNAESRAIVALIQQSQESQRKIMEVLDQLMRHEEDERKIFREMADELISQRKWDGTNDRRGVATT